MRPWILLRPTIPVTSQSQPPIPLHRHVHPVTSQRATHSPTPPCTSSHISEPATHSPTPPCPSSHISEPATHSPTPPCPSSHISEPATHSPTPPIHPTSHPPIPTMPIHPSSQPPCHSPVRWYQSLSCQVPAHSTTPSSLTSGSPCWWQGEVSPPKRLGRRVRMDGQHHVSLFEFLPYPRTLVPAPRVSVRSSPSVNYRRNQSRSYHWFYSDWVISDVFSLCTQRRILSTLAHHTTQTAINSWDM